MYSNAFCKIYNEFGWNYFPEAFGEQLLTWIRQNEVQVKTSMDLACGTGVLCEILHAAGIQAAGMDFSEGMIAIAKERNSEIDYEVADMILFRPEKQFDLVTCTGDAINHIVDLNNVAKIFDTVYAYTKEGCYFIFDILNENEVPTAEPFDLDYSDDIRTQFMITQDEKGIINLKTRTYEKGELKFEENITEIIHDPEVICDLLRKSGFQVLRCADHLLEQEDQHGTSWYIIAKK